MTERRVTWDKGGDAVVLRLSGDTITLRSSIPSPPGSRIEGRLAADPDATWSGDEATSGVGAGAGALRVKIHSSKRQEDGSFLLEGRTLDLTRELRDRLKDPD
jgi:hypothetical protein